jgi:hypothetical protein
LSVWKPLKGYEGFYWINRKGDIKNSKGNLLHKSNVYGNSRVELRCRGLRESKLVLTLLIENFPEDYKNE